MDLNSLNSGKKLIQQVINQQNKSTSILQQIRQLDTIKNYSVPNKKKNG